jgi:hypothetical protein
MPLDRGSIPIYLAFYLARIGLKVPRRLDINAKQGTRGPKHLMNSILRQCRNLENDNKIYTAPCEAVNSASEI